MKIAVYLSGVPKKTKEGKRAILTRFANGAKLAGDEVYLLDQMTPIDCDVAVIQGWVNNPEAPHLKLRSHVIKHQRQQNKHIIVIDSNLYGFLDPNDFNRYLRYSLGHVFPDRGFYFDSNIDTSRWKSIKRSYGFKQRQWNTAGNNILITLQRNGGWSMGDLPVQQWLNDIVPKLRQCSNRPIKIRPHPGNTNIIPTIRLPNVHNIEWSTHADLREDLTAAWATVTYNSSPGVASLLWGVPVWITDSNPKKSQAWPWASTDLSTIENPQYPDREEFYHRLAQCHWNADELDSGAAWQFMRQRLPNI